MIDDEDRALAHARVRDARSARAPYRSRIASRIAPPAGRRRARIGLIRCRSEASAAGSLVDDADGFGDPLARERPIDGRDRHDLDQVRGRPADRDDLGRVRLGCLCERPRAAAARICFDLRVGRRVVDDELRRSGATIRAGGRTRAADPPAPTMQNSELPPPTSTTSSSWVTGLPSVTPMRVRNASSSWVTTWSGAPVAAPTSWTIDGGVGRPADRLGAR